eukprot:CAMPEP_0172877412 /NCGR_PEP_ID=MMETSP1075-20121228/106905_1 /TAXON_ID=2916 /ORGANISM="Ceratium fusus, Strain PA161109" /LENGTH=96 /DNA_ID=CAMNT_0013728969 /DNA_START=148 /DNA_END=438 /DNA_ORIENTATION=-
MDTTGMMRVLLLSGMSSKTISAGSEFTAIESVPKGKCSPRRSSSTWTKSPSSIARSPPVRSIQGSSSRAREQRDVVSSRQGRRWPAPWIPSWSWGR